ncbi:MAG: lytic transglycosylase domain-containing protein [Alphaproteobacteria bacterium]
MTRISSLSRAELFALICAIGAAFAIGGSGIASAASAGDEPLRLLSRAVENPDAGTSGRKHNPTTPKPAAPELSPETIDPWARVEPPAPPPPPRPSDAEILEKLALWTVLKARESEAPFQAITGFMDANPDWPSLGTLRIRAEKAIQPETPPAVLLDWFEGHKPRTAAGAAAYGEALLDQGESGRAIAVLRDGWIRFYMDEAAEKDYLARFGEYIDTADHWARLDRLLWDRRVSATKRQMRRVGEGRRALALARLALIRRSRDVEAALKGVPSWLQDDPGLAYERLRWRRRNDMDVGAVDILMAPPKDTVRPVPWWKERHIMARRALRDDNVRLAYRLARDHGLKKGVEYAEAEFLAGWIALRFIGDYESAFKHFLELYQNVRYPISKARASYWAGRAAEAGGRKKIADQWYRVAAEHVTTFYGQLAARRTTAPATATIPREPQIGAEAATAFDRDELVRAVRLLTGLRNAPFAISPVSADRYGQPVDTRAMLAALDVKEALAPLLRHIARRAKTPEEWVLTARLARELGRNEIAVYVGKRASQRGTILGDLGYPMLVLPGKAPLDAALVHALVRQESAFDPGARSRAGARGLMQLMPATAKRVARELDAVGHSTARLTADPRYNLLLGSTYLDGMLERFNGSMIMALAAYNAGPHRVDRWLKEYGDPRGSLDDAIDWVESIPFSETRNYVQRVLESLAIYRAKLDGDRVALLLAEDVAGQRPPEAP